MWAQAVSCHHHGPGSWKVDVLVLSRCTSSHSIECSRRKSAIMDIDLLNPDVKEELQKDSLQEYEASGE